VSTAIQEADPINPAENAWTRGKMIAIGVLGFLALRGLLPRRPRAAR
jgi:hypothetical protein